MRKLPFLPLGRASRLVAFFGWLCLGLPACGDSSPTSSTDVAGEGQPAPVEMAGAETTSPPAVDAKAYVGSASCVECHPQVEAQWRQSHHALAERLLETELDREPFENQEPVQHGSLLSRPLLEDGTMKMETVDGSGTLRAFSCRRVIGVHPLRQFLVEAPGGRLQALSLAWDPKEKEWFDVFGEEDRRPGEWGFWAGRGMNWNAMCADCHNTAFRKQYDPKEDRYQSEWLELGVGCEACHGPGADHDDWQRQNRGEKGDPFLAAMTLQEDMSRWTDVCGTCHARRGELQEDYQPGQPLLDSFLPEMPNHSAVFHPDGQILEEDYEYSSFLLSRMHAAGVTCLACHDPHSGGLRMQGNALCLQCHQDRLSEDLGPIDPAEHSNHDPAGPGGQCIACHMPTATFMQRHPRHDHGFRVPDPWLSKEIGVPNACNSCHEDQSLDWAIEAVELWYGEKMERPSRDRALVVAGARRRSAGIVRELIQFVREEPWPAWRAVGASLLGEWVHRPEVAKTLVALLQDQAPLVRTMAARALDGADPAFFGELRAALQDSVRSVRVSAALSLRAEVDLNSTAGRELMIYLRHHGDQPTGAWLEAGLWMDRGENSRAVALLEKAVRWDPYSPALRQSLAVALDASGQSRKALQQCEKACELAPEDPALWFSLGLARGGVGDSEGALQALQKAVELDRGFARAWHNVGLAHAALQQPKEAIRALERACRIEPMAADSWFALATVFHDQGQLSEARSAVEQALQIAPDYPQAQALWRILNP